ncbi:phage tail protein [Pseudoalteromonas sp. JBTF-M23]|uniref:Phage tail protein n=1 Tax=Pseudoalteromonas caenipelagi TaxID=2726988 RepID=A0A849VF37_9GAMM|nr:phage tail protein [Pseudoalteromonas caenipelagi]NOU50544.1 phage tail protein [Pseudoalteromonas caenipelagi]
MTQPYYPLNAYRFKVSLNGEDMSFSEVSGLDIEFEPITYKDGEGNRVHMPGQQTDINIMLKRGIGDKHSELYKWLSTVNGNMVHKRDIVISLVGARPDKVDPESPAALEPLLTWTVSGAFPTKLTGPSLNASSSDIAFESVDLRADSIKVEYIS